MPKKSFDMTPKTSQKTPNLRRGHIPQRRQFFRTLGMVGAAGALVPGRGLFAQNNTSDFQQPASLPAGAQLDSRYPVSFAEPVSMGFQLLISFFTAMSQRDLPAVAATLHFPFAIYEDIEPLVYQSETDSRAYDSIVIPQRYWQRKRFEIVNRMAGDAQPRLDIGCGSSRIIQSRPDSVGLDIEMRKLRFLRATNSRLIRGSTYTLPFADESFRVVVHSQVIEHIPYDRAIFTELNRVMQLGGTLVIGTPDYARAQWRIIERLYELLMPNGYGDDHITKYTRYQLTEELASAGFAVLSYEYILGGELVMKCVKREELDPGA